MNIEEAREQGFDDGYEGRQESSLLFQTMFMEMAGLKDEEEALRHAYSFAYGRGQAKKDFEEGRYWEHELFDFFSFLVPGGMSDAAHEGYHREMEKLRDQERDENDSSSSDEEESEDSDWEPGSSSYVPPSSLGGCLLELLMPWVLVGGGLLLLAALAGGLNALLQGSLGREQPAVYIPSEQPVSYEDQHEPAEPVVAVPIDHLAIFEGVDANYLPLKITKALTVNDRYGSPIRESFGGGFRYSKALAGKTRFRVEIAKDAGAIALGFCDPSRDKYGHHASGDWLAPASKGNFVCAYSGPMLGIGDYVANVFVDGVLVKSENFSVVEPIAKPQSAPTPEQQDSNEPVQLPSRGDKQDLEKQAWDRHNARVREANARLGDQMASIRDCFPDGEPCETLNREDDEARKRSHETLKAELREIRGY